MSDNSRLESKIDKIVDRVASIDATLAAQHVSLQEHMRRSDALEKQLDQTKKEVEPLKKTIAAMEGAWKLLASAGILAAMGKLVTLFIK